MRRKSTNCLQLDDTENDDDDDHDDNDEASAVDADIFFYFLTTFGFVGKNWNLKILGNILIFVKKKFEKFGIFRKKCDFQEKKAF